MKAVDPQIQQIYDNIATYQAIALDYGVPEWQAIPIASRPDIAFRPSCGQLGAVWQGDGTTAWVWESQTIYTTPGRGTATAETLLNLQSAGVCLTGSHASSVPMVGTDEVFTKFQQQVSGGAVAVMPGTTANLEQAGQVVAKETPVTPQPGIYWGLLIPVAVGVGALGLLARIVTGKQSVKRTQKRNSPQPVEQAEAPAQPADLEQEYDFQL